MGATEQTGPGFRRGVLQFRPGILDEESAKSGPSSLGGSEGCSACFIRQNSTAEPLFSCATAPLKPGPFCALAPRFLAGRRGRGAHVFRRLLPGRCARGGAGRLAARTSAVHKNICPARGRYGAHGACAPPDVRTRAEKNKKKPKSIHAARRAKCDFWLYFFGFSLDGALFPSYNAYHYHHGLVCPCAKKMPKIFVHFDDFCPGRRAALRGVTKKRNMLKK